MKTQSTKYKDLVCLLLYLENVIRPLLEKKNSRSAVPTLEYLMLEYVEYPMIAVTVNTLIEEHGTNNSNEFHDRINLIYAALHTAIIKEISLHYRVLHF